MTPTTAAYPAERRQYGQLREVFEGAYERLEPFLDPANSWAARRLNIWHSESCAKTTHR